MHHVAAMAAVHPTLPDPSQCAYLAATLLSGVGALIGVLHLVRR